MPPSVVVAIRNPLASPIESTTATQHTKQYATLYSINVCVSYTQLAPLMLMKRVRKAGLELHARTRFRGCVAFSRDRGGGGGVEMNLAVLCAVWCDRTPFCIVFKLCVEMPNIERYTNTYNTHCVLLSC